MKQKTLAAIAISEGLILCGLLVNSLGWLDFLPRFELCGGEIYATAQSPDKLLTAYAFERSCGATTGFATFVITRKPEDELDLAEDLVRDEIIFSADGDYHPKIEWTSKNKLQITFDSIGAPKTEDIHFQVVKQGDMAVEYRGLK